MADESEADLDHEPIPAAAPDVGAGEQDPGVAIVTDRDVSATTPHPTNAGRVWVAIAVAIVLLILLIIFIAENSGSVTISFLGAHGHISLGLAMLIAAVVGALVTLLAGSTRILQLRRELRRHRHRRASEPSRSTDN